MKKTITKISIVLLVALLAVCFVGMTACGKESTSSRTEDTVLRFTAPEGTPALAILRLPTDNTTIDGTKMQYEIVKPVNIASEMAAKKSDLVIMPVNAGATLIRQGADYKLVSIAVDGSLYMIGNTESGGTIALNDIKGKKIACIGQTGVPGLIFRYVIKASGLTIVDENTQPSAEQKQVSVQYVAEGPEARQLLASKAMDFAVVGEPAATTFKNAMGLNAEMNLQTAYATYAGVDSYPQAGLFVKKELSEDTAFMNALFTSLRESKDWIAAHPDDVTTCAKESLYESANFPKPSLARCSVNATQINNEGKKAVVAFLENVAPTDSEGNPIDWKKLEDVLF